MRRKLERQSPEPPLIARIVARFERRLPRWLADLLLLWVARYPVTIVMLVAVPVGVAVVALTAIALALIMQVTGVPTGTLGAILGIGWLVGSLVLAGIAMRAATEPVTRSEASPPTGETRSRP